MIREIINKDWLFCPTGDPYVDAGGYALEEFAKCNPAASILELIEKVTDIYVDRWDGKLNTFFLNSKITQTKFDRKKKKDETKKYFASILYEKDIEYTEGYCRILGKEAILFSAGRNNSILTGSGAFVNFHHSLQNGLMLSKEVLIRLFFLPLGCELLDKKNAVLQSSSEELSRFFAQRCCSRIMAEVASNLSEGVLKSNAKAPATSLFRFIDEAIEQKKIQGERAESLTLHCFTNFGASPEVSIYQLPFPILVFYMFTQRAQYKQQWSAFVFPYFKSSDYKEIKYDEATNVCTAKQKKENAFLEEEVFKYWRNTIYERLLNDQSILPYILKRSVKHQFDWMLVEYYAHKIRKMKKETISKIMEMADFILQSNNEEAVKKIIKKLDGIKSSYLLRRFVLKDIVAKNYADGNQEPIIDVEIYANYLFPDTASWQETRNLLLIAIYQRLHEKNVQFDIELSEEFEELEETNL